MRILVTTIIGMGHFTPLIPYVRALMRRGHEVRVAAPDDLADKIKAEGFVHVPVGRLTQEERDAFFAKTDLLHPRDRGKHFVGGLFVGLLPRKAVPDLLALAETWRPDLIVREAGEYAGAVLADVLDVPHVRVSVSNGHSLTMAVEPFDALRVEHGLAPNQGQSLRAARAFSSFPASMEPEGADGAVLPQFRVAPEPVVTSDDRPEWKPNGGKPLIYVTFGTVMGASDQAKAIFRAALDAVGQSGVQALMTTGPAMDVAALGEIPDNVTLRDFVPQQDVFAHVRAVLCHGGSGTMLGALGAGLPLVVTPIGADQPENAQAVAATGAGLAVHEPDVGAVRSALEAVVTDASYAKAAGRLAAEMARHGSIAEAVDEMLAQVRPRAEV